MKSLIIAALTALSFNVSASSLSPRELVYATGSRNITATHEQFAHADVIVNLSKGTVKVVLDRNFCKYTSRICPQVEFEPRIIELPITSAHVGGHDDALYITAELDKSPADGLRERLEISGGSHQFGQPFRMEYKAFAPMTREEETLIVIAAPLTQLPSI